MSCGGMCVYFCVADDRRRRTYPTIYRPRYTNTSIRTPLYKNTDALNFKRGLKVTSPFNPKVGRGVMMMMILAHTHTYIYTHNHIHTYTHKTTTSLCIPFLHLYQFPLIHTYSFPLTHLYAYSPSYSYIYSPSYNPFLLYPPPLHTQTRDAVKARNDKDGAADLKSLLPKYKIFKPPGGLQQVWVFVCMLCMCMLCMCTNLLFCIPVHLHTIINMDTIPLHTHTHTRNTVVYTYMHITPK